MDKIGFVRLACVNLQCWLAAKTSLCGLSLYFCNRCINRRLFGRFDMLHSAGSLYSNWSLYWHIDGPWTQSGPSSDQKPYSTVPFKLVIIDCGSSMCKLFYSVLWCPPQTLPLFTVWAMPELHIIAKEFFLCLLVTPEVHSVSFVVH